MKIRNLQKWRLAANNGCCLHQDFHVETERQAALGSIYAGGSAGVPVQPDGSIAMTQTTTYSVSGSSVKTGSSAFECYWTHVVQPPFDWQVKNTITTTNNTPLTGAATISYSGIVTRSSAFEAGVSALISNLDWNVVRIYYNTWLEINPSSTGSSLGSISYSRYRHVIPQLVNGIPFTGSCFLMEWDIVKVTLDAISGTSTYQVVNSMAWEWAGPGDPEVPDSWKSPWFDFSSSMVGPFPMDSHVSFQIANLRSKYYGTSRLGNKWYEYSPRYDGTTWDAGAI